VFFDPAYQSNINGLDNHPIVHVAYRDALAYAVLAKA
jgi:formylglycine-generating enzyme required for sulfatase activity